VSGPNSGDDLSAKPEIFLYVLTGVLEYLVRHPDAKDELEGISKWWRSAGTSDWPLPVLTEALDYLAGRDWLLVRELTLERRLYGGDPKRLCEMKEFLSGLNNPRRE
jgi:hypothetical protein